MNNTFYAVNMHGAESDEDYVIPENCRVIMFCYSGCLLQVRPRFDYYVWSNIFINEEATTDFKTFIKTIAGYSSIRDHFCVYNSGDKIKNINFGPDERFRHGVFKLPVRAAVCVEKHNKVYTTDPDTTYEYLTRLEKPLPKCKNVAINPEKASHALRELKNKAWIRSPNIMLATNLSTVVKNLKFKHGGATLLLLTCREGEGYDLPEAKRVIDHLE